MPKLTKTLVDRLQATDRDACLWDSELPGFGARAQPSGRKTYIIRYRTAEGRQRKMRIARCCDMAPDKARDLAREAFAAVAAGKDPAADRRQPPSQKTVAGMFEAYVAYMRSRGRASADEVERALLRAENCAADALGRTRAAADVTDIDVVGYVASIFLAGTRAAADKHRSYISSAYTWAMKSANDYTVAHRQDWGIERNPAASIPRDTAATGARDRALAANELRQLWQAMAPGTQAVAPETAACVRLLIGCGQRVQETLRMEGAEVDLAARLWRIPAHKTKGRKHAHEVPLPAQVLPDIELLIGMHGDGPLFPGRGAEPIMDHRSINRALARWSTKAGVAHFQSRDLRRTWKSRSHDAGVGRFTRDLIQQHAKGDTGSKHYDRADYAPQMRAAMDQWEAWISANLEPTTAQAAA